MLGKILANRTSLEGLSRLEYRGYDSAGFACLDAHNKTLLCHKTPGYLKNLIHELDEKPIDGYIGIGHTRWSTHGAISQANTHPQVDCQKKISVIHNGIIENYNNLKKNLKMMGIFFNQKRIRKL